MVGFLLERHGSLVQTINYHFFLVFIHVQNASILAILILFVSFCSNTFMQAIDDESLSEVMQRGEELLWEIRSAHSRVPFPSMESQTDCFSIEKR